MIKGLLHKPLFHFLIIALFGLIAYSNTFDVPFQYDDKKVIVDNAIVKDLDFFSSPSKAEAIGGHFGYHTFKSRYIGYLTFGLNYKIHGLDVTGYHIVNLLIHISTALLLYWLVILSFRTPFLARSNIRDYSRHIAFFSALLFVSHPIQTEAVTYIWQRVSSLTTMFYLLSLTLYIRGRLSDNGNNYLLYFLSIISAIFAMKTKQTALTLPVMIALYEFMFLEGKMKKRILYLLPFLFTIPIIPLTLIDIGKPFGALIGDVSGATRDLTDMSRSAYLMNEFRVIVTYLRLIFFPTNQNLDYDYPIADSFFSPGIISSFIFLLAIFAAGVYIFKKYRDSHPHTRLISFGIFWFFITLSVESSLIPIANIICEYRVHLPSAGIFILVTTAVFMFADKRKAVAASVILMLISITLAGAAYARNNVWKNELSIWQDVVEKSPAKARGHNNVGMWYYERQDRANAIPYFLKVIELDPMHHKAHNNLGLAYMGEGRPDLAINTLIKAVRIKPSNGMYYINLGIAYLQAGNTEMGYEAISVGKAMRRKQPE